MSLHFSILQMKPGNWGAAADLTCVKKTISNLDENWDEFSVSQLEQQLIPL